MPFSRRIIRKSRKSFLYGNFSFVSDAPPVLLYSFIEQTLQPGPAVSLKCSATGNPTPQISWTLDGFPLPSHGRYCTTYHFLIILWKSNSRHPIQRKLITHFRQRAGKTTEADVQGAEKVKINLRRNLSLQYPDLICGGGKILCI